jgi:peptide/nickel transport system substrate-binding protein
MKKLVFCLLATLLVASLLISSCAKSTSPSSPATTAPVTGTSPAITSPSTTAPTTTTQAATSKPATTPAVAKQLVIAIKQSGQNFDYLSAGTQMPNIADVANNMTQALLAQEPNPTGVGKIIPGLAESWTVSPDGKMMQFTLRKGVKFHSGDPLTTADVLFSFDRVMKQPSNQSQYSTIDKIVPDDDYSFKIYFKAPDVSFLPVLGFPIGSKKYFDRVGEQEFVQHPVGTGPYKFVAFKSGEYVDLEAFDGYWGKAPTVKQVRFRFVAEDSTRVAMLKTGEADFITQVPYPLIPDIQKTKGLKTVMGPAGGRTVCIKFQNVNPKTPWYDKKVRQAIAIAINRESIVKDVMSGYVVSYPGLGPGDIGYDPDLKHYEFNPDRAKALLAEAGYSKGFDMDINWMGGEITGVKETAEAIAGYLNAVGIRAKLVGWEGPKWAEYNMKASNNPAMDYCNLGIGSYAGQLDTVITLVRQWTKTGVYASYFNDYVNDTILQARTTMDDNARAELIKKVYRYIRDDYAYIPFWTASRVFGMKDNIDFTETLLNASTEQVLVKDIAVK